jgi:diguanylate cyclase (GGDEF)-like protein
MAGDPTEVYQRGQFLTLNLRPQRLATINVFADGHGGLWFATAEGLYRGDQETVRHAGAQTVVPLRAFGLRDGIPTSEFEPAPQSVLKHDDHTLVTSTGGVMRIEPRVLGMIPKVLVLKVTDIQNEQSRFSPESAPTLPAGTRRVSLRFAALPAAFNTNADVSYRLRPIENDFRSDEQRREAVYGGLTPQTYTLELKARYFGQDEAESQFLKYPFSIAPYWHERTEFRAGLIALILLVTGGLAALHIAGLRAQRRKLLAEVAHQNRELERLARTDGLTSLANRRSFDQALAAALGDSKGGDDVGLILMDIDYFKRYNDRLGHAAGDQALRAVAQLLAAAAPDKSQALAARVGGEEFAVLVRRNARASTLTIVDSIHARLREVAMPHPDSEHSTVTVSIGVAYATPDTSASGLYKQADAALYAAKSAGRNRTHVTNG